MAKCFASLYYFERQFSQQFKTAHLLRPFIKTDIHPTIFKWYDKDLVNCETKK